MTHAITDFTPSGGDASRLGIPAGTPPGGPVKLLIYCHGVGGSQTEFGHGDYAGLRAWMDANGWAWLESNATGPGWGNQAQRDYYRAAFDHATGLYDVTDVAIFGRSMGGVVSTWLYLHDTAIAPLASGLILCSAVQDMLWMYDSSSGFASQIRSSYGVADRAGLVAAIVGHNPVDLPVEDFTGKSVLFQTGDADTIVSGDANVLAQRGRVGGVLAVNELDTPPGDHYVTRPRPAVHSAFMEAVTPPPQPPGPQTFFRRVRKYHYSGGLKYAMSPTA